jgi:hypothetical protein
MVLLLLRKQFCSILKQHVAIIVKSSKFIGHGPWAYDD